MSVIILKSAAFISSSVSANLVNFAVIAIKLSWLTGVYRIHFSAIQIVLTNVSALATSLIARHVKTPRDVIQRAAS